MGDEGKSAKEPAGNNSARASRRWRYSVAAIPGVTSPGEHRCGCVAGVGCAQRSPRDSTRGSVVDGTRRMLRKQSYHSIRGDLQRARARARAREVVVKRQKCPFRGKHT